MRPGEATPNRCVASSLRRCSLHYDPAAVSRLATRRTPPRGNRRGRPRAALSRHLMQRCSLNEIKTIRATRYEHELVCFAAKSRSTASNYDAVASRYRPTAPLLTESRRIIYAAVHRRPKPTRACTEAGMGLARKRQPREISQSHDINLF